jgi:site-specific recombinase XerD
LITVLWRAGLRIAEALALRVIDVDRDAGTICVLHGKGRKARTVGIDPGAMAMVERWLDARARLGINGHSLLFCTLKSGQIHPTYVRAMLKRKARKAGIERRVHPHGLRHTLAAEMREEGADIGVISKQLGHSSIATTARYVDHLAPTVVIETMQKRTWDIGVH